MSKATKFVLPEGRGSLWKVAKEERRHKDIRFNGKVMVKGELCWVTLFKNTGPGRAPDLNLSIGDKVKSKK
jgi:hypothetical protein